MLTIKQSSSQSGVAILFAVLLVGFLLSISLALAAIFIPKIAASAATKRSVAATYAAESCIEWCIYNKNKTPLVAPAPVMSNGATFTPNNPATCLVTPINVQGTYQGITRAFQVSF